MIGLSTNLNDAAPGVVVFIVGVLCVWITRFNVREIETIRRVPPPKSGHDPSMVEHLEEVKRDIRYANKRN
jgi:hypothetical protein